MLPLVQGTLTSLLWAGWKHWNSGASTSGRTIGSRVRRWWYEVNDWAVDQQGKLASEGVASDMGEVSASFLFADQFS